MCKVLVVDDHESITAGISKMIERVVGTQSSIYTANTGTSAEEMAIQVNPDIVFTDIRMPDFTGIELVSRLKRNLEDTRYIIMSGYDDFTYARDALRLGVVDYLLKPVDREDVERLVKESLDYIKNRKELQKAKDERSPSTVKIDPGNANLCRLFEGTDNVYFIEELKSVGMELAQELCTVLVFEKDIPNENSTSEGVIDENAILTRVKMICEEYLNTLKLGHLVFLNFYNQIIVVINHNGLHIMEETSSEIIRQTHKKLGISISCGVGNAVSDFDHIRLSYNNAKISIRYKVLFGTKSSICHRYVKNRKNDEISNSSYFKHVVTSIETYDLKGIEKGINDIFYEFSKNNRFTIEGLISACHSLYLLTVKIYNYNGEYILTEEDFCNVFRSFYFIQQFNDFVKETIGRVCEGVFQDDIRVERKKIIEKAMKFIRENYYRDISLAYVANFVSRNYTYFSKLFKNETGLCFSDYLREYRIEKAKELIRDTDQKITDVAKAVGFTDNVHFCKSFSQKVGMSPNKYREKLW